MLAEAEAALQPMAEVLAHAVGFFSDHPDLLTLLKIREPRRYQTALELIDTAWLADEVFSVLFMSMQYLFMEDSELPLDEVFIDWHTNHI